MTTFTKKLRLMPVLFAAFLVGVTSCKKNNNNPNPTPEAPVAKMTGKLDGKDINITAANLTTTYYTSSGDAASSLETSAALDANGSKLNFFIDDLKTGTINITPKLGSSSNPGNPNQKILATAGPAVQTYVQYYNGGNTYYALSGFVKIEMDQTKGLTVTWEINFKDATGRTFTSAGSFFIPVYTANPKPKTEVKDPTPVAAKPTIDNIAPTNGFAGDTVSIAGTNFSTTAADNVLKFNNTQATVISATATKIMVIAPQGGTSGDLTLKVKNSEQITGPAFTYLLPATFTALTPNSGVVGDIITLSGTNFSTTATDNVVLFNGVPAKVESASATSLKVTVPANATTGVTSVTVKGRKATLGQGFDGLFTVNATQTNNPIVVGDAGQAYILNGSYSAFAKASDNEGNLYLVNENQQLFKVSPSGQILKSFTKADIIFKSMNTYKCVAITSNKKGAIRALFNCSNTNGQVEVYIVAIGTSGTISKEVQTTFFDTGATGMAWDNSNYYLLSSNFNTDDVVKISGTDGGVTQYLKGGANGDFNGNGAYSMDFDGSNNLFVLSYLKGPNTSSIPTKHAIYKFDTQKVKSTILASYNDGYSNGGLDTARFRDLRSIVVSNQDLFVGDNGNFRIRKIALRTNLVTTLAGNGKQFEASNGNQPLYVGGLLNVNMRGSNGLMLNTFSNALYNFSSGQVSFQKFVLN